MINLLLKDRIYHAAFRVVLLYGYESFSNGSHRTATTAQEPISTQHSYYMMAESS